MEVNLPGIFVLGAGRSGTSVITRIVNMLGVPTCIESDLLSAGFFNPRGFWESITVTFGDELLLALSDGTWYCPPSPEEILRNSTPRIRETYGRAFWAVHPTAEWVCKDPRLCFTISFWRETLRVQPAIVLAIRHPNEVAASVAASVGHQTGIGQEEALALWERSIRTALTQVNGLPAIVAPVRSVIDRPREWCAATSDFLRRVGFSLADSVWRDAVDAFVDPSSLHTDTADATLSAAQLQLFETVLALEGHHNEFVTPSLSPETPSTTALLSEMRNRIRARGFPKPLLNRVFGAPLEGRLAEMYFAVAESYGLRNHAARAHRPASE